MSIKIHLGSFELRFTFNVTTHCHIIGKVNQSVTTISSNNNYLLQLLLEIRWFNNRTITLCRGYNTFC